MDKLTAKKVMAIIKACDDMHTNINVVDEKLGSSAPLAALACKASLHATRMAQVKSILSVSDDDI